MTSAPTDGKCLPKALEEKVSTTLQNSHNKTKASEDFLN